MGNMETNKIKKRIWMTSIICCTYLLLASFYYHIDKYTSGVLYFLLTALIPITFVAMMILCIKGIIIVFKHKNRWTIWLFMPFVICALTLIYAVFSPYRLDSENLENKENVILRACYEGTQNQATWKFWEDHTFELHSTGVFFISNWTYGTYEQKADTLFLHYSTEKPTRLGDTILIKDGFLLTVYHQEADTLRRFLPFYIGNCKGRN